jgi:hypothetical protein
LSYSIRGVSAPAWSTAYVTDDGTLWTVVFPATITAGITAGSYTFERHYTGSGAYAGQRFTVQLPRLEVVVNAAAAAAGALQSLNEKMLAAIASLLYPASGTVSDVASYTIHSRQITRMNKLELEKWYGLYAQRVKREKNGGRNAAIHIALGHARN